MKETPTHSNKFTRVTQMISKKYLKNKICMQKSTVYSFILLRVMCGLNWFISVIWNWKLSYIYHRLILHHNCFKRLTLWNKSKIRGHASDRIVLIVTIQGIQLQCIFCSTLKIVEKHPVLNFVEHWIFYNLAISCKKWK